MSPLPIPRKPRNYVRAARTRGTPWFTWVCIHRDCQYGDRIGLPVTPSGVVGEEWHPPSVTPSMPDANTSSPCTRSPHNAERCGAVSAPRTGRGES